MFYFLIEVYYCFEDFETNTSRYKDEKVLVAADSFKDAVGKIEDYYKSDLESIGSIEIICSEFGAEENVLPLSTLGDYLSGGECVKEVL